MSFLRLHPELLQRFRAGERDALEQVYRAYLPRLSKLIRRGFVVSASGIGIPGVTGGDELADVLQEVFTRAFQGNARNAYDGCRDYAPYLATIARNLLVSRHRRQTRELLAFDPASLGEDDVIDGGDSALPWMDAESLEITRGYVSALREPIRAVHTARYVQALSQRDAAKQLGLSRPKLRKLESRLRLGLQQLLMQAGLHPEAQSAAGAALDERRTWTSRPRTS
jgi:RNA polymerase sigma factor (sigma-70 family)